MKKFLIFLTIIVIILIGGVLIFKGQIKKEEKTLTPKISMPEESLKGKKVAMIIAFREFRDIEYFKPREILEKAGAKIVTVSTEKGLAIGADGGEVEVNLTLDELNVGEFDGIVFIGGPGALKYLDSEKSYEICQEALVAEKILAAICISPVILAKAGVLNGKKATVWTDPLKSQAKILRENGAEYLAKKVVVDGKIITGNGPGAAEEFGEKILELLR
jgi:protease I